MTGRAGVLIDEQVVAAALRRLADRLRGRRNMSVNNACAMDECLQASAAAAYHQALADLQEMVADLCPEERER